MTGRLFINERKSAEINHLENTFAKINGPRLAINRIVRVNINNRKMKEFFAIFKYPIFDQIIRLQSLLYPWVFLICMILLFCYVFRSLQ